MIREFGLPRDFSALNADKSTLGFSSTSSFSTARLVSVKATSAG
jgi:hypothetical protein